MTEQERLTMTVGEAAKSLGISRQTAYKMANNGTLPAFKMGRRILISKSGIDQMLNKKN
jgi:excisionase family DNA binding protein